MVYMHSIPTNYESIDASINEIKYYLLLYACSCLFLHIVMAIDFLRANGYKDKRFMCNR